MTFKTTSLGITYFSNDCKKTKKHKNENIQVLFFHVYNYMLFSRPSDLHVIQRCTSVPYFVAFMNMFILIENIKKVECAFRTTIKKLTIHGISRSVFPRK